MLIIDFFCAKFLITFLSKQFIAFCVENILSINLSTIKYIHLLVHVEMSTDQGTFLAFFVFNYTHRKSQHVAKQSKSVPCQLRALSFFNTILKVRP